MAMLTGNATILRTVNGLRLPKLTVCLKFHKTEKSISLDSRFVNLENTGFPAVVSNRWTGLWTGLLD